MQTWHAKCAKVDSSMPTDCTINLGNSVACMSVSIRVHPCLRLGVSLVSFDTSAQLLGEAFKTPQEMREVQLPRQGGCNCNSSKQFGAFLCAFKKLHFCKANGKIIHFLNCTISQFRHQYFGRHPRIRRAHSEVCRKGRGVFRLHKCKEWAVLITAHLISAGRFPSSPCVAKPET